MSNLAEIGHNNPPTEKELLEGRLSEHAAKITAALDEVESMNLPDQIENVTESALYTDAIKKVKDAARSLDSAHKDEKSPFKELGDICDAWKRDLLKALNEQIAILEVPLSKYLAEQERIAQEKARKAAEEARAEAERLAKLAAETEGSLTSEDCIDASIKAQSDAEKIEGKLESGKLSDFARTRGIGSTASRKVEYRGQMTSRAGLDLETLRPYFSLDAIEKAIAAFIRDGGRELRGAEIKEFTKLNVR